MEYVVNQGWMIDRAVFEEMWNDSVKMVSPKLHECATFAPFSITCLLMSIITWDYCDSCAIAY